MALLMFRTFGVIIVSFIVLIMYVLHRKKNGKFIKRKAVNEEYQNMKTTEIAKEVKRRIEETISEYEPKEA